MLPLKLGVLSFVNPEAGWAIVIWGAAAIAAPWEPSTSRARLSSAAHGHRLTILPLADVIERGCTANVVSDWGPRTAAAGPPCPFYSRRPGSYGGFGRVRTLQGDGQQPHSGPAPSNSA